MPRPVSKKPSLGRLALLQAALVCVMAIGCGPATDAAQEGDPNPPITGEPEPGVTPDPTTDPDPGVDPTPDPDPDPDPTDPTPPRDDAALLAQLRGYEPWASPPPDAQTPAGGPTTTQTFAGDNSGFTCTTQSFDVTKSFDRVLGLGAHHASAKPGILLQGKGVLEGQFNTVPLKRSPITISVDLPIKNPRRVIQNPSVDTIQQAIAEIQQDIDAELPVTRSSFTHSLELVDSSEEASLYFGVNLSYSAPLWGAGLKATFDQTRSLDTHYVALKHIEELYTITFSDDLITSELDFLAPDVTVEDLQKLEASGMIGAQNPPTYVKSVTYGRLVLATSKITKQLDTRDLELTVKGNGFGFTGDATYKDKYKQLASTLDFNVLALGATTAEAKQALANAKIEDMFGPAKAANAVPLYYAINFVKSPRPTAKVGTTTQYSVQECVPNGSKRPCVRSCPVGWADAGGGQCTVNPGISLGNVTVRTNGGDTTYATPMGAVFPVVDSQNLAASSQVCINAKYTGGGIWDNANELGYRVACGAKFRDVTRHDAWTWKGNGVTWCWDVPLQAKCGVTAVGPGSWTPGFQGDGTNVVSFWVERFTRPHFTPGDPRCY